MRYITILVLLTLAASLPAAEPVRPNVIVILADDMGIDSVSAFNDKMGM
jgi:hypothetical protein